MAPHVNALSRSLLALLLSLVVLGSFGCGAATSSYDYKKEPDPRTSEYQVGPLDQLKVVVWKNQELSADVVVRPDGVVTLPLIGDVKAAGRTPSQIQKEISQRYANFIRVEESVVSVGVSQVNSLSFTISGNVEKPGVYQVRSYVTALEAIATAGGTNKYAGSSAYIVRGTPSRKIPIDLKQASSGEHPEQNVVVLRGDLIVVQ
ncbi:MAG TPA: polysaccharide biosynthesis/export family protein [Labilithrix sp.]|nr:polysaccharide biosynthesis/export family protein [Labilithrix sp.]